MNYLGDLAHDARAAAEVQILTNPEVGAPRVDIRVSSEEHLEGDAVGLGDVNASFSSLDGVGAAVRSRHRLSRRSAECGCSKCRSDNWRSAKFGYSRDRKIGRASCRERVCLAV